MHSIPFRTQHCSKCIPKLIQNGSWGSQNGVIGGQNGSDGAKWTLGAPRCAQREVKVRQDGPKRNPKEPLGTQDDPKGSPMGAQSEPKRFTRGERGCPRAPKLEKVDCSKSLKTIGFYGKNEHLEVNFGPCWLMLGHLGSMLVHFGSS